LRIYEIVRLIDLSGCWGCNLANILYATKMKIAPTTTATTTTTSNTGLQFISFRFNTIKYFCAAFVCCYITNSVPPLHPASLCYPCYPCCPCCPVLSLGPKLIDMLLFIYATIACYYFIYIHLPRVQ